MLHISQLRIKPKTIEYWRNPTKAEIKFGHGAIHYREFDFKYCFSEEGYLKYKIKALDDNLVYYYTGTEYQTAKNSECFFTELI
ncbi:MAG: hypothetical protein ACLGGV_04535 [Bacteroidia bacterium]